jgi:sigma-B regulation protein RsbU (phosphoserine phosphatase)
MNAASMSPGYASRPQLLERRARLQAGANSVSAAYFNDLIAEIDAALGRIDAGSYGLCETCHDTIEADRLASNPLVRFCLDHLSQADLLAHQQDLDLATEIQSKLLPPRDIALENWDTQYRYRPVGAVGGDYCELVAQTDVQSLFFAVGDVAGKGVAASFADDALECDFPQFVVTEFTARRCSFARQPALLREHCPGPLRNSGVWPCNGKRSGAL